MFAGSIKDPVFTADPYGEIPVQAIASGDDCAYKGKETVVVIRSNAEWEEAWSALKVRTFQGPVGSLPEIGDKFVL